MRIKEELKFWLKTGRFKHFQYGIPRQQLLHLLGTPSWAFHRPEETQFPCIYGWGKFEFHFWEDEIDSSLEGIVFKAYPGIPEKSNLSCNYHKLSSKTTMDMVVSFLYKYTIDFEEKPTRWQDGTEKLLYAEGQVEIIFDNQRCNSLFVLDKMVGFANHSSYREKNNTPKRERAFL